MFSLKQTIEYLFYFFIFLLPLQTRWIWHQGFINGGAWEYGTFSVYGTEILLWIILILFFWYLIKSSKPKAQSPKLNSKTLIVFSLFGLILISTLSILWAPSKYIAFYSSFLLIQAVALWIFIVRFPFDLNKAAWAFVSSGVTQSLLALWQFSTQNVYGSKWLGVASQNPFMLSGESVIETGLRRFLRAYGTFGHPNILGGFLVIAILLSIFLFFYSKNRTSQIIGLIFTIVNIMGLTLSFSRSAYLAFIVSTVLYLAFIFLFSKAHITRAVFFAAMFIASALLLGIIFQSGISPRFDGSLRLEKKSLDERGIYLKESIELIKSHPVLGLGKGNFTEAVRREINEEKKPWEYQPVHNIYLLVTSELGIFGIIFFIVFLFASFIRLYKLPHHLGIALFSAILTIGFFDHYFWDLYSGILLFWLILGVSQKPLTDA